MEINYCDYGCGQEARFILRNGKHCCSKRPNQCLAIRKKNSEALKSIHLQNRELDKKWNCSEGNKQALRKGFETHIANCREKAFMQNSRATNASLRYHLINYYHWELRCNRCGLEKWQNEDIPLELHHKNGISTDNRLENLEFLCLNCHAITDSFRGKNINTGKVKVTDEELKEALKNNTSIRAALLQVGLAAKGGNYTRAHKLLVDIEKEKLGYLQQKS